MANQGATYYDGVPANSALGNLVNMVPSPDAVSEFRVQTNSNSAEYGRYSGGVINITSKSGTNQYHGSAYEYFRNTDLNANLFFANATGQGKAPFHQNQYGLMVGGPIKKNKIFFFAAGKLMPHARAPIISGPCRFRPCITETSRATGTRRAR